ncbi:MAG: cytidylate kinase-like family protein [Planctomycetota bacterium]
MAHATHTHSREIDAQIERQIRNWELARQQKTEPTTSVERPVEEFIAISRAAGLPADDIATALHERVGWPVFDKEILQAMSGDDVYRKRLYATMDERDLSWLEECLRAIGVDRYSARNDYFHRLRETVLALARQSHAIFVGRAADLILPGNVGMRIRLSASHDFCVRQYAARAGVSPSAAEQAVEELERERAKFFLNHFGVEASEPTRHDLILNMERFTAEQAVDVILAALRLRGVKP